MIEAEGGTASAHGSTSRTSMPSPAALETVRARFGEVDMLFNNERRPAAHDRCRSAGRSSGGAVRGDGARRDRSSPTSCSRRCASAAGDGSSRTRAPASITPIPNLAVSNALRLSLVELVEDALARGRADGVTVNIVVPGRVATDRDTRARRRPARSARATTVEEVERASIAAIPAGVTASPRSTRPRSRSSRATRPPTSPARCCASTAD